MTDLEPFLHGCDCALAEAERLVAMLSDVPDSLEPELLGVRTRITRLRREVDRLRGMPIVPPRRKIHPDWIDLVQNGSPWATLGGEQAQTGPPAGG